MKHHACTNKGFTLIEVLMALGIMTLAAICAYDFLRSGLLGFRTLEKESIVQRESSIAFALLSRDLRSSYLSNDDPQTRFVGHPMADGDQISFVRMAGSPDRDPKKESIRYELIADGNTGRSILRRTSGNDFSDFEHSTDLCSGVESFRVKYFDGSSWQDEWGWDAAQNKPFDGIRGLPLVISVHLRFKNSSNETIDETQTIPVMTPLLNSRTFPSPVRGSVE